MRLKADPQATRDPDVVKGLPLRFGVVNRETFADKALAFCRASGRIDSEHPVIRLEDDDKGPWLVWMAFFARLGVPHAVTRQRGTMTVPTLWPWDFSEDADCLRDRVNEFARAEIAARPKPVSPERRKQLGDMLRGVVLPEMRGTMRRTAKDRRGGALGDMPVPSDVPLPKLSDEALGRAARA